MGRTGQSYQGKNQHRHPAQHQDRQLVSKSAHQHLWSTNQHLRFANESAKHRNSASATLLNMLPLLLLLLTATTQALIFKTPVNRKLVDQLMEKFTSSMKEHCWNIWKANLTKAMLYKLIKTFQRSSCESNLDCATIPGHNSGLCLPRSSLLCLLSFHSESRLVFERSSQDSQVFSSHSNV